MTPDEYVVDKMQQIGRYVDDQVPPKWGWIVLAFPFGAGGRMNYISNADRPDVVRTLYEFIEATRDSWAGHEPEGAVAEDAELGRLRQQAAQQTQTIVELQHERNELSKALALANQKIAELEGELNQKEVDATIGERHERGAISTSDDT